ncbi:YeeE/YedE family protein [Lysobacter solisilvae (ex Woo and Kim 2020)]|uniref:YeeE/YedE family protein n=1 Tax=Agrilutibacter terrestris TaxID=2865112 RepID=A0A7H0FUR9_9GAMM|nr:YeeE/YedE family protein [Lysobacter terrestris]QNP39785.1 YeeE/YedE family protein [Lysobacter terrestris]
MPTEFTPVSALLGGALIGLAATLLYALLGRIAGISGIVNAAVEQRGERGWRVAFLLGLVIAATAWLAYTGAPPRTGFGSGWLIAAGLLVGFGTRLGNGCTSGHGICGLARLSKRSLVAVLVFMGVAFATTYVLRHVLGGIA